MSGSDGISGGLSIVGAGAGRSLMEIQKEEAERAAVLAAAAAAEAAEAAKAQAQAASQGLLTGWARTAASGTVSPGAGRIHSLSIHKSTRITGAFWLQRGTSQQHPAVCAGQV